ncbi:MAG: hypothetical protein D3X82_01320 [Candidatus Leucobacter sulfamidivorax]|nr:hypothetical protein [Candidatus Leucobacter sulfamidivorax]
MSQHHRAQQWSTHSPKLREKLTAMMRAAGGALPCVECGHPVILGLHKWQVGHRRDASRGGAAKLANVGPVHCKSFDQSGRTVWPRNCNQKAGGKLGAAVTNRRRRQAQDIRPW